MVLSFAEKATFQQKERFPKVKVQNMHISQNLDFFAITHSNFFLSLLLPFFSAFLLLLPFALHILSRGDSHMKQTGMLIVSLRGINFRFWSRLGCSRQSTNILCRQGLA